MITKEIDPKKGVDDKYARYLEARGSVNAHPSSAQILYRATYLLLLPLSVCCALPAENMSTMKHGIPPEGMECACCFDDIEGGKGGNYVEYRTGEGATLHTYLYKFDFSRPECSVNQPPNLSWELGVGTQSILPAEFHCHLC